MAGTLYSSLQYRTVTAEHMAAEIPSVAKLIASGAVQVDANPPFKGQGGITFNVPHYLELTGTDAAPAANTDATLYAIATFKDVGVICEREYVYAVEASAQLAIGQNEPIGPEILRQVPLYWGKKTQLALYSVLQGAFHATGGIMRIAQLFYDFQTKLSGISAETILSLSGMGDTWEQYRIWVMHSAQFGQLVDAGLVTYQQAGAFGERVLQTGLVPTFLGKQVVFDDNINTTNDGMTYLMKPGAMYLGFQADPGVEYERKVTFAGGTDAYAFRATFMPHLFGLNYAGAAKPANTTLATGASWTLSQSTDYKLHKAIALKFTV